MEIPQTYVDQAIAYIDQKQTEWIELIHQLCAIPAPSHQEHKRAEFITAWLKDHGCQGAYIDEAGNVIFRYPMTNPVKKEYVALLAHIDTVFPDLEPFTVKEEGNRLYCPGVGDDTANVALLMLMARYFVQHQLPVKTPLLFAFDTGEEGLGNLKGCRHLFDTFGSSITEMIALDGTYEGICHQAVGSLRYRVTVTTEGGHSYGNFGNSNAIVELARLIDVLYSIKVPPKTTYNVGEIQGGTSVNTIAQKATMLYEIRSVDRSEMERVRDYFETLVTAFRTKGIGVDVELLGERPCMGEVDLLKMTRLTDLAKEAIERYYGKKPRLYAGSTDCNIPFSRGIPAICFGAYLGSGAHTREEYIERDSLLTGGRIVAWFLMNYVG